MVKDVIHDPFMLSLKSAPATKEDLPVAADLSDTLKANKEICAGMASPTVVKDNKPHFYLFAQ